MRTGTGCCHHAAELAAPRDVERKSGSAVQFRQYCRRLTRRESTVDTIIVVPCYNEASRLDIASFENAANSAGWLGFIFVDDGSTDSTSAMLSRLRATLGDVAEVHSLPANGGKGEAVRAGINQALTRGVRYVGYWDADLATPLDQIVEFRRVLEERPQVVGVLGSRIRRLGAHVHRSAVRHYLGRVFATVASAVLKLPVYDTQAGAKLFRSCDDIRMCFAERFYSKWSFDVEVLARIGVESRRRGLSTAERLYEYPLPQWSDVAGSKLGALHMAGALVDLYSLHRRYR